MASYRTTCVGVAATLLDALPRGAFGSGCDIRTRLFLFAAKISIEQEGEDDREDGQGDHLLDDLELHQVERTAVAVEADAVRRDGEAVLEEGDAPREQDDEDERPAGRYLHLLEFEMPVPRERHEDVRKDEHDDGPDTLLHSSVWNWGAKLIFLYDITKIPGQARKDKERL